MFGTSFGELVLVFVIGLLILGPERLPRVAAQIGRWVAKARRTANQLRYQLEREIALEEIHKNNKKKPKTRPGEAAPGTPGPESGEPAADTAPAADASPADSDVSVASDSDASTADEPMSLPSDESTPASHESTPLPSAASISRAPPSEIPPSGAAVSASERPVESATEDTGAAPARQSGSAAR